MIDSVKKTLAQRVKDDKLVENLFDSYERMAKRNIVHDATGVFQNTGLFVEAAMRMIEHLIFGSHTSISGKFWLDSVILKLEKANGADGLRIHAARLCRAIYDLRSRKNAIHLKDVDPEYIDADLILNVASWIFIEILKESSIIDPEEMIRFLATRKIPLVQAIDGILRTTNPKLKGPDRILLLLYAAPAGLSEDKLLRATREKIKNKNHLMTNLRNMDKNDLVHHLESGEWIVFGQGPRMAEEFIAKFGKI